MFGGPDWVYRNWYLLENTVDFVLVVTDMMFESAAWVSKVDINGVYKINKYTDLVSLFV